MAIDQVFALQAKAHVAAKIETMTYGDVLAWLHERLANCTRIAAEKQGKDRDGWLDDATYFLAAIGIVEERQASQSEAR